MPQLDFSDPLMISKLVWLLIIFGLLYYVLKTYVLPQVASVLDERAARIAADLDAARDAAAGLPVRFTGYADYDAAPAVYAMGDVFVSPTHAEGFSNTILEAMASGLPVVSCRAVGVMDCLRHEENGLMTEPGDVPALAESLARIVTDGALRRRLAEADVTRAYATLQRRGLARSEHGRGMFVLAAPRRAPDRLDFSVNLPAAILTPRMLS